MTDPSTPLDLAHAAMEAAPDDDRTRLRFYDRLAAAELVIALQAEAEGDTISPLLFPVEEDTLVLAFDTEDRLTAFFGSAQPYAAMSGRRLAAMLASEGLGLGLNLDVAPSAMVLPAAAVAWLAETTAARPDRQEARPEEIGPPRGVPEVVLTALDARLAASAGLAKQAYLVSARYAGAGTRPLLAFIDAVPGAEDALAQTAKGGRTLAVALNYGSQNEIARAAAKAARAGAITPETIAANLDTADLPPLDLLIRTSGEVRLSNFLLWQCAYAEMLFVETLWPDFTPAHLRQALDDFANRERRYGGR